MSLKTKKKEKKKEVTCVHRFFFFKFHILRLIIVQIIRRSTVVYRLLLAVNIHFSAAPAVYFFPQLLKFMLPVILPSFN